MKNAKFLISAIVIIILVILGFWYFNSKTESLEKTKVRIANLPSLHGLPVYLAFEKGYFKEAGLDVEIIKFEAPNQIIDAIVSGQVDFTSPSGASGIAAVADFKNPGKIKIYAFSGGDYIVPNDSVVVKKDSNIKSLQDLKGKKIGILPGIQWRTLAKHMLSQVNLVSDEDVTIVELAPSLQAQGLASGQVDALIAIEPMLTIVKGNDIGKEIVHGMTNQYVANPFYGGGGIVNVDFAKNNPNTTAKMLAVFDRAIKEIQENPSTVNQYLKGYTALDSAENLISQAPILRFKMYNNLTGDEIVAIQKYFDVFTTYKIVDGKIDAKNLLYSSLEK